MSFPFQYPAEPRIRRHGPIGYADYASYRPWVRDEFSFRCVYCLFREQWGLVRRTFGIDHFLPVSLHPEAVVDYHNLVYACAACNDAKGAQILPDPCAVLVDKVVSVYDDGTIHARTPQAQFLIRMLGLDDNEYTEFRLLWIGIIDLARRNDTELFKRLMGYPEYLPDLGRLEPPGGNSRPQGLESSFFVQKQNGTLPEAY